MNVPLPVVRMPASYSIDASLGVVFSRRWGVLTEAELRADSWTLAHDPRFDRMMFRQLADLRDVVKFDVSATGVHTLTELNPFARNARRAGVVRSGAALGILRLYQRHGWGVLTTFSSVAACLKRLRGSALMQVLCGPAGLRTSLLIWMQQLDSRR